MSYPKIVPSFLTSLFLLTTFHLLCPNECTQENFLRDVNKNYDLLENLRKIISECFEENQTLSVWQMGFSTIPVIKNQFVTFDHYTNFDCSKDNLIFLGNRDDPEKLKIFEKEKLFLSDCKCTFLTFRSDSGKTFPVISKSEKFFSPGELVKILRKRHNVTVELISACGDVDLLNVHFHRDKSKGNIFTIGYNGKIVRSPIVSKNFSDSSILRYFGGIFEDRFDLNVSFEKFDDVSSEMIKRGLYDAVVLPMRVLRNYKSADVSNIFFYDTYNWVLRKPSHVNSFKILIFIFNPLILIVFVCFYFLMVTIWYLFFKFSNSTEANDSFFIILKIITCTGVGKFPRVKHLNMLLIFFYFYSICIVSLFQARMASLLAKPPFERTVNNLNELINSSIVPLVDRLGNNTFRSSTIPIERKLGSKIRIELPSFKSVDLTLDYVIANPNITVIVSDSQLLLFKSKSKKLKKIDNLTRKHESAFYFRKRHPLLKKVNRVIDAIFESGIIWKWLSTMEKVVFEEGQGFQVLEVKHFSGAFLILLIGYVLGTFCFLSESIFGRT